MEINIVGTRIVKLNMSQLQTTLASSNQKLTEVTNRSNQQKLQHMRR